MTERLSPDQLDRAASLLQEGKLVAFPTETVYGLGASVFNPTAIERVFQVKGRPADNPLIVHISALDQLGRLTRDLPASFFLLAAHFFPGPLTLIVNRHPDVPKIASAGLSTIAIRMPSHPIAQKLIAKVGDPLVAPSANLSGKPSATSALHVWEDFDGAIDAIIEGGPTEIGIESTVLHLLEEEILLLRPGAIGKEAIEAVLNRSIAEHSELSEGVVHSPGMKYRHYAPKTKVKLFLTIESLYAYLCIELKEEKRMVLSRLPFERETHFTLSAKDLYAHLRTADREKYAEICIFCDAQIQRDTGLMNRIFRASGIG